MVNPECAIENLGYSNLKKITAVAALVGASLGVGSKNIDAYEPQNLPLSSSDTFEFNADVAADSYLIGNIAAINYPLGGGWTAIFGDKYNGTSTVNTNGTDILANTFIADPGSDGELGVQLGGSSSRHIVVDSIAQLKKNSFTKILESPFRIKDSRQTGEAILPNGTIKVSVGLQYAGEFAILNLAVDRNSGPGWQAMYPCSEGYKGTSSINVKGDGGAQALMSIVKVDENGEVCVRSMTGAVGTIVDFLGTIDTNAEASKRILDTRIDGTSLQPGVERSVVVGEPNSVFVGTIASTNPSIPGWLAAYTNSGTYNGTSTLNSDGVNSVANMVIMKTDSNGAIQLLTMPSGPGGKGLVTDVVIDGTMVPELAPFLTADSERLVDSRTDASFGGGSVITPISYEGQGSVTPNQLDFKCYYVEYRRGGLAVSFERRFELNISGLNPDTNPDPYVSSGDRINTTFTVNRVGGIGSVYGRFGQSNEQGIVSVNAGSGEQQQDVYAYQNSPLDVSRTTTSGSVYTSKFLVSSQCISNGIVNI